MEHSEQIEPARPSDAAPLPAPSAAFSQVLKNWLALFSEHYRQEISELSAVAYLEGLADLTAAQLNLACAEALRTCRFLPNVADIRAALAEARSRMQPRPGRGAVEEKCPQCQGLGWRIVPRVSTGSERAEGEGNWAVRCGCRVAIAEEHR